MPRGDQLARQWRLLQLLGRAQGLAVNDASRELGCAVRTVWRDLRVLQEGGFPIYDERDGRRGFWRVEEGFRDRLPIPLSLPEIVALPVSRDLIDHGGAGPFGPVVASTFAKIRALLTPRALELVERMRASVGARMVGAKLQPGAEEHLAEIHRALAEQRTLRMRYYSLSRNAETDRRVDPYHVTFYSGGLYLMGYCHLRRDVRIFAVERVRAVTVLHEAFVRPADFRISCSASGPTSAVAPPSASGATGWRTPVPIGIGEQGKRENPPPSVSRVSRTRTWRLGFRTASGDKGTSVGNGGKARGRRLLLPRGASR